MTHVREATEDDRGLLERMLVMAADWRPEPSGLTVEAMLGESTLAHYVTGWPRPGDAGVVVEDAAGTPLGAAWFRLFTADDPGFGFVSADVPEVSIAVVPDARGRGLGRRLMETLIASARRRGVGRLSLSVEVDNPARRLYASLGFVEIGTADGAVTMLLDLRTETERAR